MTRNLSIKDLSDRVKDPRTSDYFLEAVRCFDAQAYRACIIMTSNAVFASVIEHIEELARGEVKNAKSVLGLINKQVNEGRTLEGALVTKLKESGVIPVEETDALSEILSKRNNAAHPSKSVPQVEDAYYVVEKAVKYFLCDQVKPLKFQIDALLCDIYRNGFFTDLVIDDIARKVEAELSEFELRDHPKVVTALQKRVDEDGGDPDSKALWFLLGMLAMERPDYHNRIYTEFFKKKGFNTVSDACLIDMCVIRPSLLSMVDEGNRDRLDHALAQYCQKIETIPEEREIRSAPALLRAIIEEFGDKDARAIYPKISAITITRFWSHPEIVPLFKSDFTWDLHKALIKDVELGNAAAEGDICEFLRREDTRLADALTRGQVEELFQALMNPLYQGALHEMRCKGFIGIPNLRNVIASDPPAAAHWRRSAPYVIFDGENLVKKRRQTTQ